MREPAHSKLKRWAVWTNAPSGAPIFAGCGTSILQRILEGQGTLLPGKPRVSGVAKAAVDHVAQHVEWWLMEVSPDERKLAKVYYLSPDWMTVEEKAAKLGVAVRTMYSKLYKLQEKLNDHTGTQGLAPEAIRHRQ